MVTFLKHYSFVALAIFGLGLAIPAFAQTKLPSSIYATPEASKNTIKASAKIHYERGKPLSTSAQHVVEQFLQNISSGTLDYIHIGGHTDTVGTFTEQMAISKDYTEKTRQLFLNAGVPSSQISISWFGAKTLYKDTRPDVSEPLNRRVEFTAHYVPALTYEDGISAFEAEDFARAVNIWTPLAKAGHTDAQVMLGARYFEGRGVAQSNTHALYWIRKSAEAGNLEAMLTLNILYSMEPQLGISSEENYRWKLERAKRGDASAQNSVARRFEEKNDLLNAKLWHEKAAAQGDEDSAKRLAEMKAEAGYNELLGHTVSTSGALLGSEKFPVFVDTDLSDTGDVAASCTMIMLTKYPNGDLPPQFAMLPLFYTLPKYNGGFSEAHAETQLGRHLMTSHMSPEQGPTVEYCEANVLAFIKNRVVGK